MTIIPSIGNQTRKDYPMLLPGKGCLNPLSHVFECSQCRVKQEREARWFHPFSLEWSDGKTVKEKHRRVNVGQETAIGLRVDCFY